MEKTCPWASVTGIMKDYHDKEWGVPVFDDSKIFEFIILEGAQAGLSWLTILKKRENYRTAFSGFDPVKVAVYTPTDVNRLLENTGIIRNRMKIEAAISNAGAFLNTSSAFGSFSEYIWAFTDGIPIQNSCLSPGDIPAKTDLSVKISKDMKNRGFKFFGPVICYSHMQASGMVNDHMTWCYRYNDIQSMKPGVAPMN
jgi:DNA-3-methyladenine glycosylase I